MLLIALKMLIADRAKFLGILIGLTFATFIITQQAGILTGIMKRTYGFITDTSQPDIWVVDKKVSYIEDIKSMRSSALFIVRGIEGVEWAVPMSKGNMKTRFRDGNFQQAIVIGIDDATLIGGPPVMVEGSIVNLRDPDGVIVNDVGAERRLATLSGRPLQVGDVFEIRNKRAKVVGICQVGRTFRSDPVIYTTFKRSLNYDPPLQRELLSFILVKAKPGVSHKELCNKIAALTDTAAYTSLEFKKKTIWYYIKETGIVINFGFAVVLGFIIGVVISGQTFYNFALDNLRYFAIFKAMGAKNHELKMMIGIQALFMGFLGFGLGVGLTTVFGIASQGTELSFSFPWELYLLSFLALCFIIVFSSYLAIRKIVSIDPAMVFQR